MGKPRSGIDQDLPVLHGRLHRPGVHEAHRPMHLPGLELHEMLAGAYKGITSPFKQKGDNLNKVFAVSDDDDVDCDVSEDPRPSSHPGEPRVIVRIARTMGGDGAEHMNAMTVPLKIF